MLVWHLSSDFLLSSGRGLGLPLFLFFQGLRFVVLHECDFLRFQLILLSNNFIGEASRDGFRLRVIFFRSFCGVGDAEASLPHGQFENLSFDFVEHSACELWEKSCSDFFFQRFENVPCVRNGPSILTRTRG